jgi:hypothetical protein
MRHGLFSLSITCALVLLNASVTVRAQNAFHPNPLDSLHINLYADTLFSDRASGFVLGHQWGPASLDKLNSALRMNVTTDNYGYMHELTVVSRVMKVPGHLDLRLAIMVQRPIRVTTTADTCCQLNWGLSTPPGR